MTTIFFLFTVIFIIYEVYVVFNPRKLNSMVKDITQKDFFKSDKATKDQKLNGCLLSMVHMFYLFWSILGLALATQWISFALLFVIGLISGLLNKALRMKGIEDTLFGLGWRVIDSAVSAVILFDIFMVHFRGDSWGAGIVKTVLGL